MTREEYEQAVSTEYPHLLRLAMRLHYGGCVEDAEDSVQDALGTLNYERIDPSKGTVRHYLTQAVKWQVLKACRGQTIFLDDGHHPALSTQSYDAPQEAIVLSGEIEAHLSTLPEAWQVVVIAWLNGDTFQQMADHHHYSKQRAHQLLTQALGALRRKMQE